MKKERFKNILLVFLVIMNFVLGSKILVDKKLWPDGYNFFSNVKNLQFTKLYNDIKSYFAVEDKLKTKVLFPENIVVNTGDQTTRISLHPNDADFENIYTEAEPLLKSAFSSDASEISTIEKNELYSALSSNSLFLEFPRNFSFSLFSELLGNPQKVSSVTFEFSNVVISYSPRASIYIADSKNDMYYKINVQNNTEKLVEKCNECLESNAHNLQSVINYSYDLKFDKPFGTQKTTLNPFIRIYSTKINTPIIESSNPIIYEDGNLNENIIYDILRVFNINSGTMRRYTQAGGTEVFVENNAILKISKSGLLEYSATDTGLEISSTGSEYSNILNTLRITSEINRAIGNNCVMSLSSPNNSEISFDYMIEGAKVNVLGDNLSSGVTATVENGKLKRYKQLLRNYTSTPESEESPEFFSSLDNAISQYSEYMTEINIEKMYLGYIDDGSAGKKNAQWIVKVDNVIAAE